jgi:hypothetical protein
MFDILNESNSLFEPRKKIFSLIVSIVISCVVLLVAIIVSLLHAESLNPEKFFTCLLARHPSPLSASLKVAGSQSKLPIQAGRKVWELHLTKRIDPDFPGLSGQARFDRNVIQEAITAKDGRVSDLELISRRRLPVVGWPWRLSASRCMSLKLSNNELGSISLSITAISQIRY